MTPREIIDEQVEECARYLGGAIGSIVLAFVLLPFMGASVTTALVFVGLYFIVCYRVKFWSVRCSVCGNKLGRGLFVGHKSIFHRKISPNIKYSPYCGSNWDKENAAN